MKGQKIFKNIKYLNVKKGIFETADIAIDNGKIVGINGDFESDNQKDYTGKYLVPGFIDGHIHLESSIISPEDFAKIVVEHGTTSVITDPHEIANVCGIDGIDWMMQKTKNLPINVYFMISSCVPATPFDESAYTLTSKDVKNCFEKFDNSRILGLAEVMNFPGVINNDPEILNKINIALSKNKVVDGHAPGLTGEDLEKYIKAGIMSDHECSTLKEAIEKLEVAKKIKQKFYIMIRQGTAAKNLEALVNLMKNEEYKEYTMFATDDKHPEEIYNEGHIDSIIRKAIKLGVTPETVYTTASYNAARYFNLNNIGSIEVEKNADILVLSDINNCKIEEVYKNGNLINNEIIKKWPKNEVEESLENKVRNSINMKKVKSKDFEIKGQEKHIIELIKGEIITKNGGTTTDYNLENDIIKVAVIESHKGTMHTGIAYLKGMGLKNGAIGTTVAHDSHYLIVAGTNDEDIAIAVNEIIEMHGGKVTVENGKVKAKLPLPIANLMTDENPKEVIEKMKKLKDSVEVNDGIDPFMNLSFVSLAVIGNIRLLPGGVFDVQRWNFIKNV